MKTIVIYKSRKGYIKEVAEKIKMDLADNASVYDLADTVKIDFSSYDNLVFAGSVMVGRFSPKVKKYIIKNLDKISGKKAFLLSAGLDDKAYLETLKKGLGQNVLNLFSDIIYCGGRFLPENNNPIVRKLMAKINGSNEAIHKEKPENVEKLIKKLV